MKRSGLLDKVFYNAAYAMVGTQATAAIQVAVAVQNLSFILVRGIGSCSIMLETESDVTKSNKRKRSKTLLLQFLLSSEWSLVVFKA